MSYACVFVEDKQTDPDSPKTRIFTVDMKRIGFTAENMFSHVIEFDPSRDYIVAIDQSTSSVGLSIATSNFDFVVVMNLIAGEKTILGREAFVEHYLEFIFNALRGKKYIFVAAEAVPPAKGVGGYSVFRVLSELRARLWRQLEAIPEIAQLPKHRKVSVLPQTWKSTIYDKKSAAGKHFNDKAELAKDICKIYPGLKEYRTELSKVYGHDFDAFDSFGILTHVRLKHFGAEWEQINRESLFQRGVFYVLMRYLEEGRAMEDFMSYFKPWSSMPRPDGKVLDALDGCEWNKDFSIYENFTMMANFDKIMFTECLNPKMVLSYLVETGEKYDKNKILWIAVCKGNGDLLKEVHLGALEREGFTCHRYFRKIINDR